MKIIINHFFYPFASHPEEGLLAEKDQIYLTEIDEGQEPEVFWVALGGEDDYGSLLTGKLLCL